jgi:hypothetical protein
LWASGLQPGSRLQALHPAYRKLCASSARTSGTAVTRIFSVLQVHNRNEDEAFAYMKKLRQNVQLYTKSGGGGTLPVGLGQAGGGIFFIVDAGPSSPSAFRQIGRPFARQRKVRSRLKYTASSPAEIKRVHPMAMP